MAEEHQIVHEELGNNESKPVSISETEITGVVGNGHTDINELPDEVLVKIFSYLSAEELQLNTQFVCTRWSHLSFDNALWKNLVFTITENMSVDHLSTFLHKVPNLQCVEVYDYTAEILYKLAECCKNLRKLKENSFVIHVCPRGEETMKALQNLVMECTKLEELVVPGEALHSEELAVCVGLLTRLHCITITSPDSRPIKLKHLADGCPSLQHLDMRGVDWCYSDLKYFLEQKKKLICLKISHTSVEGDYVFPLLGICRSTLRELHLKGANSYFEGDIDEQSFSVIKTLTSLTSLKIEFSRRLPTEVLENIFEKGAMSQLLDLQICSTYVLDTVCDNCPHLVRLQLSCYGFEGWGHLNVGHKYCAYDDDALRNLSKCTNLEELILDDRHELTVFAMNHIARCRKLKSLELHNCTLSEMAVQRLLKLSELRHLTFNFCKFAKVDFDIFPLHLKKLKTLTFFDCDGIDAVALNVLHTEMPNLRVCFVC